MVWLLPLLFFSSRTLRKDGDRPSYPTSFFSILLVPCGMPMHIDVSYIRS